MAAIFNHRRGFKHTWCKDCGRPWDHLLGAQSCPTCEAERQQRLQAVEAKAKRSLEARDELFRRRWEEMTPEEHKALAERDKLDLYG